MRFALAAAGIPAALLAASAISLAFVRSAPLSAAAGLHQPLAVVTNWGTYGLALYAVLVGALVLATACYLFLLRNEVSPRIVAAVSLVAVACAAVSPVVYSSDVYAYAAYGHLAALGLNPYSHVPLDLRDPLFAAAAWQWGNPPPVCVYGPLFVACAAAIDTLLRDFAATVRIDALRALCALALPACGVLAYYAYSGTRAQRSIAATTIALNPAAIWCAAEGHNDALALCVVLGGLALSRSGLPVLGAALASLGGTIKLPAIAGGFAALRDRRAIAGVAIGVAATLAFSIPLVAAAATELAPHGRYAPQASLEALIKALAFLVVGGDGAATALTWAIAALLAAGCGLRAIRTLRNGRVEGWILLGLGAWLLIPNPYPWYALWLLPLAALAPASRYSNVVIAISVTSLLRYAPDAIGAPDALVSALLGAGATLPYLGLFRSSWLPQTI